MNELTYTLIDRIDSELRELEMVQKLLTNRTFANYEKIGDESVDIIAFREEAAGVWALSELILKQMTHIRKQYLMSIGRTPQSRLNSKVFNQGCPNRCRVRIQWWKI